MKKFLIKWLFGKTEQLLKTKEIDLELAKSTLKSIVNDQEKELSVDNILEAITSHFDVDMELLTGKCRKKETVFHPVSRGRIFLSRNRFLVAP